MAALGGDPRPPAPGRRLGAERQRRSPETARSPHLHGREPGRRPPVAQGGPGKIDREPAPIRTEGQPGLHVTEVQVLAGDADAGPASADVHGGAVRRRRRQMEGGRQVRHRDAVHGECQARDVGVGGNVHVAVLPGEGPPGGHGSRDAPGGGGEGNQVARLKSVRREAHRGQGEGRGPPVARQVVASAQAEAQALPGAGGGGGEGGSRAVEGHRSA